jgi:preprotein translocase subunit SecG
MKEIIIVIDVLAAVGIIGLVLLQHGKGADMGAAFGAGASQTLFGSRGAANFLTRTTAVLAIIFFIANLSLAWMAAREAGPASITRSVVTEPAKPEVGAMPEKAEGKPGSTLPPDVPK